MPSEERVAKTEGELNRLGQELGQVSGEAEQADGSIRDVGDAAEKAARDLDDATEKTHNFKGALSTIAGGIGKTAVVGIAAIATPPPLQARGYSSSQPARGKRRTT